MIKEVLESAAHLNIYAQIALVLFVMAFVSVLLREWIRPRKEVDHLANMPLSDGSSDPRIN